MKAGYWSWIFIARDDVARKTKPYAMKWNIYQYIVTANGSTSLYKSDYHLLSIFYVS